MKRCLLSAVVLFVGVATMPVRGDDPVSSNVRYTGEIVRIFERKCAPCHGPNSIAMPLANYRQVRDWGRAIREEIVDERMPPWSAARGYGRFRTERALTLRESATILSWLDGGMARGDDRDLPAAPASPADPGRPPDLRVAIPRQHVPAREDPVVRRATIETNLARSRPLTRLVVTPGQRSVLRGALVFVERDGRTQWIGAWSPWDSSVAPPLPHAFDLPPKARLTIELHYRGAAEAVDDEPRLDLYFADADAGRTFGSAEGGVVRPLRSAEGGVVRTVRSAGIGELQLDSAAPARLPASTTIWAIVPSAGDTVTSIEITARRPNGSVDLLLWIPRFQPDWPEALALEEAVTLPAGTIVTLNAQPPTAAATARLSVLRR